MKPERKEQLRKLLTSKVDIPQIIAQSESWEELFLALEDAEKERDKLREEVARLSVYGPNIDGAVLIRERDEARSRLAKLLEPLEHLDGIVCGAIEGDDLIDWNAVHEALWPVLRVLADISVEDATARAERDHHRALCRCAGTCPWAQSLEKVR